MKFLHISDIHFDPVNDGEDTNILREKFMDYLKEKNIIVDEIFFTGDFRHALHQMGQSDEETAKNACEFLENIAQCSLKSNNDIYSHLHIVPGNHDLSRGNGELLDKIYEKYDLDKANFKEIIENEQTGLDILLSRFDFFQRCAEILKNDIWTCMLNGQVCHVKEIEEYMKNVFALAMQAVLMMLCMFCLACSSRFCRIWMLELVTADRSTLRLSKAN